MTSLAMTGRPLASPLPAIKDNGYLGDWFNGRPEVEIASLDENDLNTLYMLPVMFNGRRELPSELTALAIKNMVKDPRYQITGKPRLLTYTAGIKAADCAKWGSE